MSNTRPTRHLARLSLGLALLGLAAGAPAYAETEESLARDLVPSQKPLYQIGSGHGGDFAVEAWVDSPDLVYRVGQQLKVYVRPKQTSYITVLNIGSSGKTSVIFPNYYQQNSKVYAGQTVVIPADSASWRIDVAGPPGVDFIQVVATRERLDLAELRRLSESSADSPILSLDRSAEAVARDLIPQLKGSGGGYAGGGFTNGGIKNLLVRVLPRHSSLQAPPFAGPGLGGAFGLTLRPERPIYKIGESVRVAVAVQQDCHLSLVSIGTSGRAVRLFPNKHQPYSVLRAGQTLVVPSPHAPYQYKAEGPAGVEGLMATCRGVSGSGMPAADLADIDGLKGVTRDLVTVPVAAEEPVEHVSSSFIVWN